VELMGALGLDSFPRSQGTRTAVPAARSPGLRRGATASGRVLDGETGLPIPGMKIDARAVDGHHIAGATTDGDGSYASGGIPDGVVEVLVRGQGYVEMRKTLTISDGADVINFDF